MSKSKIAAVILLLSFVVFAHAAWNGLWGETWDGSVQPARPIVSANVQAQSYAGNSPIVQSYYLGEITQYDIDAYDLRIYREYYRVHAWKGDVIGNTPGFIWTGTNVRRDVTLYQKK